jgi:hypothetical protein
MIAFQKDVLEYFSPLPSDSEGLEYWNSLLLSEGLSLEKLRSRGYSFQVRQKGGY